MGRWVCDGKDVGGLAAVRQRGESGVRRRGLGLGLATATATALVLSGDESLMINDKPMRKIGA